MPVQTGTHAPATQFPRVADKVGARGSCRIAVTLQPPQLPRGRVCDSVRPSVRCLETLREHGRSQASFCQGGHCPSFSTTAKCVCRDQLATQPGLPNKREEGGLSGGTRASHRQNNPMSRISSGKQEGEIPLSLRQEELKSCPFLYAHYNIQGHELPRMCLWL